MLVVRRVPVCARFSGIRSNASLQQANTSADAATAPQPPSPPPLGSSTPEQQTSKSKPPEKVPDTTRDEHSLPFRELPARRRGLGPPRRWNRPIGKGVLPVYDLALQYIKDDSKELKADLEEVRKNLRLAEDAQDAQRVETLNEKAKILEIQSQINLPDVRWKAANRMIDMKQLIYRYLNEKQWREDGPLDLLMERVYQMHVVPDMLPDLHPTIDLRVIFPEAPPEDVYKRTRVKRDYEEVEPGVFLVPEQTWRPPMLYTTVWHTDTRLYTLFLVDLDVPDEASQSFQAYLHWMQPNIGLSACSVAPIHITNPHTPYVPPHPQRGTPYHRYVMLLLPQASPTERIRLPKISETDRLGFNFRAFAEEHGFDGSKGGGAHMWREVWNEAVSSIYCDVLKTEEPLFGRLPKEDPYETLKSTKKYI